MLTLSATSQGVEIGLLAVDEQWRHHGIGTRLVQAARLRAGSWGCATVQVVTQVDNAGACRLYEQGGFRLEQAEDVYHLWL